MYEKSICSHTTKNLENFTILVFGGDLYFPHFIRLFVYFFNIYILFYLIYLNISEKCYIIFQCNN